MKIWLLFFAVCLGLGYPTLNRYDPRKTGGLSDTGTYYDLATHGPVSPVNLLRFRILVPTLARPIAQATAGHVGSWDPVFLGFLIVNAIFTATTASLLVVVARILGQIQPVALLSAALYLLNFEVSNIRMSGMVDSAEGCFLMAIVWSLLTGRLLFLPLWGILGALDKETFVPLCVVFVVVWWIVSGRTVSGRTVSGRTVSGKRHWLILSPVVASVVATVILQSAVSGHFVLPWQFAAGLGGSTGERLISLKENLLDRNILYCVVWLVPLGLMRIRKLPETWTIACAAAVLADLALATWHSSTAGASARPFFSVAGPMLSLSAAMYLSETAQ